jgi:hypothetical protein
MSNFLRGAGPASRGATAAATTAGRLTPGLNVFFGGAATLYDLSRGDYPGAALSLASMFPIIGTPAAVGRIALEGYRMTQGNNNQQQSQSASESPEAAPAATPQATMMPQASELSLSTPTPSASEVSEFQSEAGKNIMDIDVDASKSYAVPSLISSQAVQNIPSTSPNIGALPDPQPNVVMLPSTQRKRQQQMISGSSGGSDVPLISSSNPDNFYVLYSQLNYNVVM